MTIDGTLARMDMRGKYERSPETRAKNGLANKGKKLSKEEILRRTATRYENGTYGTHGHNFVGLRTPTYNSWDNMIQRCTNPNRREYQWYGERGIRVCKRWLKFSNFLEDMGERPEGLTLDRIDNDGDYEPENCRWADKATQMKNRKRSSYYDREPRANECGHPDKPHKARGMCANCYRKWRTS